MHCRHCDKHLRSSESVKCEGCESRFHVKCVSSIKSMEGGDHGYQWKCAVCQHPAEKCSSHSQTLLTAINHIREKFELVKKIQLPKLNNDLLLLRSTAERIVKQNEDILKKIDQLHEIERNKIATEQCPAKVNRGHRRPLNSMNVTADDIEEAPMLATSDNHVRYRTRRRSYHLYKVFLLVNRKLRRTRTPRNKTPR